MTLFYLIEKEFKQLMRNIILPVIFVVLPLGVINVIPRIASQEVKNLKFSFVDNDHSPISQRLLHKVGASTYFNLVGSYDTHSQAMATIENCDADIIVAVEPGFEKNLINTGVANVSIAANAVNGMKGALGSSYAAQIVADFAADLRSEAGLDATATVAGFDVVPRYLFNPTLDYKFYMIPALLALLLIILVGFLPALNIVGEKEKGTIEQINVTPVGKLEFILSKIIPYAIVGLLVLTLAMALARGIHGFSPAGHIGLIYGFSLVFIVAVASLGLIISNYSGTTQQAALTFFFFMMIFMLTSGLLTPVASMPDWAKTVTQVNPMRFYMDALRSIYLKGSPFSALTGQFLHLIVISLVLMLWAIVSYRKNN